MSYGTRGIIWLHNVINGSHKKKLFWVLIVFLTLILHCCFIYIIHVCVFFVLFFTEAVYIKECAPLWRIRMCTVDLLLMQLTWSQHWLFPLLYLCLSPCLVLVQEESVLSYQLPVRTVPRTRPHTDTLSPPQLPFSDYRLEPSTCAFVFSEPQHHHMASLETSLETAHKIENSTKEQVSCIEWHQLRRCRIPSTKFREVFHTRGESSVDNLAKRLLRPCHQAADMRRGLDLELIAVEEYCSMREVIPWCTMNGVPWWNCFWPAGDQMSK